MRRGARFSCRLIAGRFDAATQLSEVLLWCESVEKLHALVAAHVGELPQTVADIETRAQELAERIQLTTQVATPAACDRTVQDCGCAVAALVEADHIHVTLSQTPYARTIANIAGRDISLSHRSAVRAHDWGKSLARCLAMPDSTKRRLASVEALEFRQRLAVDLEELFARLSQLDQTLRVLSQFARCDWPSWCADDTKPLLDSMITPRSHV